MRLFTLSVLGMATLSIASAGQIEIGATSLTNSSLNTTTGISTGGLDAAYVAAGSGDTWAGEKVYNSTLFTGDTVTGVEPTSGNGMQQYTDTNNPTGSVVFAMDGDGNNFWSSATAAAVNSATSINIPVGVFSVSSASILLNDYWGVGNTDTVTFNFANAGTVSYTLTDGNQISSATDCHAASTSDTTSPLCTAFNSPPSSASTDIAWTSSYTNSTTSTTNPYAATSGTLNLDDITFAFTGIPNFSTDTLNSITITDNNNCTPTVAGCSAINSRLALSAITVDTTPEPSTDLLLVAGLGIIGYLGRRRKVRQ